MNKGYIFEYRNENEFKKLERSVKKYNMLAYKKLTFEYYDDLKNGKFLGKLVSTNSKEGSKGYELRIPTDEMFTKVHDYTYNKICKITYEILLKRGKWEENL